MTTATRGEGDSGIRKLEMLSNKRRRLRTPVRTVASATSEKYRRMKIHS
jgi:hypothetical protein